ncbi:pyridine nucleotide-disulfide oxidoreductase [Kribbella voronezhensis]|uniref:Pyridine nucleotide-disulfide oxidoreductase n=1 Tax=Kribbella voronezhensis TaxID=2512212 RepID=A0A4R7TGM3_9ACTN|nr:FAD-dependent oxidoreductase [Kribbella voronezhensis]TDU90607.1 pyridine nucleotide-disulfide oxidoreductase [Kribbella voronezhensis]
MVNEQNNAALAAPGRPVVVIGAGPVGLAAAAHLAERGVDFLVLESGPGVAAAIEEWRHVKLFSPWRYDIDSAARRLLQQAGWVEPELGKLPTGGDLIDSYLEPLTKTPQLNDRIRYNAQVVAVTRVGFDRVRTAGRDQAPFLIRLADGSEILAAALIDAAGTWRRPNVLGGSGIPARGEADVAESIAHALPDVLGRDRDRYAGRRTAVVGAGHSAATTLLDLGALAEEVPGTEIVWVVRGTDQARTYGGGEADELPARGALGSRLKKLVQSGQVELVGSFRIEAVSRTADGRVELAAGERRVVADTVVNSTGFRPDHDMVGELRLDLDSIMGSTRALAPLIDPNQHSCGTVPPHGVDELAHPEPGYYAVGAKSYGRAPTFLLATGYEQARSVVAALAGDWAAARDVQLDLPETGVCSSNLAYGDAGDETAGGCCGPAPQAVEITAPAGRGLATGISGGLLTVIDDKPASQSGCCG